MEQEKYFVFFISAGRTGTRFLGSQLCKVIENSFSVHEPDVLTPRKGYQFADKLKKFGFYHLILGKIIGKTGIRNLSQRYIANKLTLEELKAALIKHREKYYEKISEDLIIESYSGWYGCIPAIKNLYDNYKIVIITRDPKDWVTSNMNWGTLFGEKDWVSKLGLNRLNPKIINDKEYINKWKHFSRFEKICWTYKTQYEIMLQNTQYESNAKIVKFEDLFYSINKYNTLNELLSFITTFPNKKFGFSFPDNILNKVIHKNTSDKFPEYSEWKKQEKDAFEKICGPISKRLNY